MKKFRKKLVSVALSTGITLGGVSTCSLLTQTNCKAITLDQAERLVEELQKQTFYLNFEKEEFRKSRKNIEIAKSIREHAHNLHKTSTKQIVNDDILGLRKKAKDLYREADELRVQISEPYRKARYLYNRLKSEKQKITIDMIKLCTTIQSEETQLENLRENEIKLNAQLSEAMANISALKEEDCKALSCCENDDFTDFGTYVCEIDNDHRKKIKKEEIEKLELLISQNKSDISSCEKKLSNLKTELNSLEKKSKDNENSLSIADQKFEKISAERNIVFEKARKLYTEADNLLFFRRTETEKNLHKKAKKLENQAAEIEKQIQKSEDHIDDLNQQLELLRIDLNKPSDMYNLTKIETLNKKINNIREEINKKTNEKEKLLKNAEICRNEAISHTINLEAESSGLNGKEIGPLFINENYQLNHTMLEMCVESKKLQDDASNAISIEELTDLLFGDIYRFLETTNLISPDDKNIILGCFRTHSLYELKSNINGLGEEWNPLKRLINKILQYTFVDNDMFIADLKAAHKNYVDMIKYFSDNISKENINGKAQKVIEYCTCDVDSCKELPENLKNRIIKDVGIEGYKALLGCSDTREIYNLFCYYYIARGGIGNSDVWARYFSKLLTDSHIENCILHISDGWHDDTRLEIVAYKLNGQWYGFTLYNTPEQIQHCPGVAELSICLENISKLYKNCEEIEIILDENGYNRFLVNNSDIHTTNETWESITNKMIRQLYTTKND